MSKERLHTIRIREPDEESYVVGYGRPPESTRIQKGELRNPFGRPKGSLNTYTLLQKMLNGKITLVENGKRIKVTRKFALLMRLLTSALQGDHKAAALLLPHMLTADAKSEAAEEKVKGLSKNDQSILENYINQLKPKGNENVKN